MIVRSVPWRWSGRLLQQNWYRCFACVVTVAGERGNTVLSLNTQTACWLLCYLCNQCKVLPWNRENEYGDNWRKLMLHLKVLKHLSLEEVNPSVDCDCPQVERWEQTTETQIFLHGRLGKKLYASFPIRLSIFCGIKTPCLAINRVSVKESWRKLLNMLKVAAECHLLKFLSPNFRWQSTKLPIMG